MLTQTKRDVVRTALKEQTQRRELPWRRDHSLLAAFFALLGVVVLVAPADAAAIFGHPVLDGTNSAWLRAGVTLLPLVIALGVRGHPWPYTVVLGMISLFGLGQILRSVFSPELQAIPLTFFVLDLAVLVFCAVLAVRPGVYERLDAALSVIREQDAEGRTLRSKLWEARVHGASGEAAPFRRFQLICEECHLARPGDGLSSTGPVAEGVLFQNGLVVMSYLSGAGGLTVEPTLEQALFVHGHGGRSQLVFLDPEQPAHDA